MKTKSYAAISVTKVSTTALTFLVAAMLVGLGITPAMAQHTYTPGIDRSQQEINARIQQGIASGHISQQESQQLLQRERELRMREARMKADGRADPQERQRLREDLASLHAQVERKMSNPIVADQRANRTPGIDQQQQQIHARIEQGVRIGRITQSEAKKLRRQERDIERQEARFKSDGRISQQERRQLQQQLAALHDNVERMMNNTRARGDGRPGNGYRS